MKRTNIIKGLLTAPLFILLSLLFSSCDKNEIDETGYASLKVVNASPGSPALSFHLAGSFLVDSGLGFTSATGYMQAYAGTRLSGEFRDAASAATYATGELWLYKNNPFTVFVAGEVGSTRVKVFDDDLSAPDNGKTKIRFIHLSDDAPSDIKIEYANGDNLITNLSRNTKSGYKNITPGTLSFKVYGTGQGALIGDYEIPDLQAGKIYTIYFTGTSASGTMVHSIVHN